MKYSISQFALLAASVVMIGGLSACSVDSETWVNQHRLEIHEDQFTDTVATKELNDGMLRAISVYYYRYGNGSLSAAISYDPKSRKNNLAQARSEASRIQSGLQKYGVRDVQMTTTPVPGSGEVSTTVVTFSALTAHAPTGCKMMPGYDSPTMVPATADGVAEYEYGCTIETLMAKQVSRPSDLLGKAGFDTNADGRRQASVMENRGYYSENSNKELSGETSTSE